MANQIFDRDDPPYVPEPEPLWLTELRRRDWAVRVLDAEAADRKRGVPFELHPNSLVPLPPDRAWYVFKPYTTISFYGPTPDAARLAAALAVFPSLPADVRAKLGECP